MTLFAVPAAATLDDGRRIRFDAAPWLRDGTAERLRALAAEEFGAGPESEALAHDLRDRPGYEGLDALLCAQAERDGACVAVQVDAGAALAWLARNRPGALPG